MRFQVFLAVIILMSVSPGFPNSLVNMLKGNKLYKTRNYTKALKEYEKSLSGRETPEILYNLGNVYYQKGDFKKSKLYYKRALDVTFDDDLKKKILYNLGNLYYNQNDLPYAVISWKETLVIDPDDSDARRNLEIGIKKLKKQIEEKKRKQNPDDQNETGNTKGKDTDIHQKGAHKILKKLKNLENKTFSQKIYKIPSVKVDKDW